MRSTIFLHIIIIIMILSLLILFLFEFTAKPPRMNVWCVKEWISQNCCWLICYCCCCCCTSQLSKNVLMNCTRFFGSLRGLTQDLWQRECETQKTFIQIAQKWQIWWHWILLCCCVNESLTIAFPLTLFFVKKKISPPSLSFSFHCSLLHGEKLSQDFLLSFEQNLEISRVKWQNRDRNKKRRASNFLINEKFPLHNSRFCCCCCHSLTQHHLHHTLAKYHLKASFIFLFFCTNAHIKEQKAAERLMWQAQQQLTCQSDSTWELSH